MARAMWIRWLRVIVPAILILGVAGAWWLRSRPNDRELIAATIRRAEHGVETKNAKEVMSCVSPDYRDNEGLTRTQILRLVMAWSREAQTADVSIEDYRVSVAPPQATATMDALVSLRGQGNEQPMKLHLTVQLQKERRRLSHAWLVRSVEGYQMGRIFEGIE